jgi:two-component system, sensor histidine kinase LadS
VSKFWQVPLLILTIIAFNVQYAVPVFNNDINFELISRQCKTKLSDENASWEVVVGNRVNIGIQSKPVFLRCKIDYNGPAEEFLLEINAPWIDYIIHVDSKLETELARSGELVEVSERATRHRLPVFRISLKPGSQTFFFKMDSPGSSFNFPVFLSDRNAYIKKAAVSNLVIAGIYTLILILSTISLAFAVLNRELLFVFYAVSLWTTIHYLAIEFSLPGILFNYSGPNLNMTLGVLISVGLAAAIEFHRRFLTISDKINTICLIAFESICLINAILFILGYYDGLIRFHNVLMLLCDIYLVLLLIYKLVRKEIKFSIYYTIGWLMLLMVIPIEALISLGFINNSLTSYNLLAPALILQALFFTAAVIIRFRESFNDRLIQKQKLLQYETELNMAKQIQERMLPSKVPLISGFKIQKFFEPLREIGGDLYNFSETKSGQDLIIIADVQGHGYSAALDASSVKLAFLEAANKSDDPASILKEMSRFMYDHMDSRFVAALVMKLTKNDTKITLANAGLPYPTLYRENTGLFSILELSGTILGIDKSCQYENVTVKLEKEDFLLCFSDGLIDDAGEGNFNLLDYDTLSNSVKESARDTSSNQNKLELITKNLKSQRHSPWSDDVTAILVQKS